MLTVLGDIILDIYQYGSCIRHNPETSGNICDVTSIKYKAGGAAAISQRLNCPLISVTGHDNARIILKSLLKNQDCLLCDFNKHTTTKTRLIIDGSLYPDRIDYDDKKTVHPSINDRMIEEIKRLQPSTLLISDYEKGVVTSYLLEKLNSFSNRIIVDPGKNSPWNKYPSHAIIKANLAEAQHEFGKLSPFDILHQTPQSNVIITDGANGLFYKNGSQMGHINGISVKVVDICGAGDCVLAILGKCLDEGESFVNACIHANKAASLCVQHLGVI